MTKEIAEKQLVKYVKVEAIADETSVKGVLSIDIGALLDDGAAALKAKIPGSIEEPFVDAIVAKLKEEIGLNPKAALAAQTAGL